MGFISPLTDEEKRRRLQGVLEDGEVLGFDVAFLDSAPSRRVFLTDQQKSSAAASHKAMRDAAYASQYDLPDQAALTAEASSIGAPSAPLTSDSNEQVRNLARAAQFGG
jgi:hypothetical protein